MASFSCDEQALRKRLHSGETRDRDYWSFRRGSSRRHAHALFQYPAMMVPLMQQELMKSVIETCPDTIRVLDPFVGSGTVLTEAMMLGLDFCGQDINPLAVLLCRVKSGPFRSPELAIRVDVLLKRIRSDSKSSVEADFPNMLKWFDEIAAIDLSRIRRGIRAEKNLWMRRFFWVCLAETVRQTSNSRTSTFKLHIRPLAELQNRSVSPIQTFQRVLQTNLGHIRTQEQLLERSGLLDHGSYKGNVDVQLGDTSKGLPVSFADPPHDLLITSPPYGDNKTTVPYGQHSYLPLQWIDFEDIDERADKACLRTTHELDTRSLGGRLNRAIQDARILHDASRTLRRTVEKLSELPRDRKGRVAAFCRDLDRTLDPVVNALRPGAYMIWTVGNRTVGGRPVPMDVILEELLSLRGAALIARIPRPIPTKRMALKNNISQTMRSETILVMRKS